jgi:hypothetical protein
MSVETELNNQEIEVDAQFPVSIEIDGEQVGLLLNFGRRKLEYRRIFPSKNITSVQRVGRDDVWKSELG